MTALWLMPKVLASALISTPVVVGSEQLVQFTLVETTLRLPRPGRPSG